MRWDPDQLAALTAVVDHGTFDAAATALHVTPSAVSQRIKALENVVGQVVVTRSRPCRPTSAGEILIGMARRMAIIEGETIDRLALVRTNSAVSVAINADSLNTWFHRVIAQVARRGDLTLRLHVDDQSHSAELLRAGTVLAAIASDPVAVQGCSATPIGVMRYVPMAAESLLQRHRPGTAIDWNTLPMLQFNEKDDLQHRMLRLVAPVAEPPIHRIPSSADFAAATRLGLGWSMLPENQLTPDDQLVRLGGRRHIDVPLFWHRWRLSSVVLDDLTETVVQAASAELRPARTAPAGMRPGPDAQPPVEGQALNRR